MFHLTSDIDDEAEECPQVVVDVVNGLQKKIMPRLYAAACTIGEQNYPKKINENESWGWSDYATLVQGVVLSQFSPTLKFRFNAELHEQAPVFERSDVCYASQPIGTEHIGLYGTLAQGLQGDLWGRIQREPSKFFSGVVKLVAAVAHTAIVAYGVLYSNMVIFAIARGILMYEAAVCVGRVVVPILFGCIGEIPPQDGAKQAAAPSAPPAEDNFGDLLPGMRPLNMDEPGSPEPAAEAEPAAPSAPSDEPLPMAAAAAGAAAAGGVAGEWTLREEPDSPRPRPYARRDSREGLKSVFQRRRMQDVAAEELIAQLARQRELVQEHTERLAAEIDALKARMAPPTDARVEEATEEGSS